MTIRRLGSVVRAALRVYDHAGFAVRRFAAVHPPPEPAPTVSDDLQRRLALDEERRADMAALWVRFAAVQTELLAVKQLTAQAEAEAVVEREAATLALAREAQAINRSRGLLPS